MYIYISPYISIFDDTSTKMIPQDTKQIFTSLHESSSAAAAEHRVTWAKPMGFALNNDLQMTDMRRLAVCLLLYWRVICAFMMVYEYSSFFIFLTPKTVNVDESSI
jgi:hypothetical protein